MPDTKTFQSDGLIWHLKVKSKKDNKVVCHQLPSTEYQLLCRQLMKVGLVVQFAWNSLAEEHLMRGVL